MEILIREEEQCLDYLKKSVNWLNDFYNAKTGFFRVSYKNDEIITDRITPNAATSIIGRVVNNCMGSASDIIDDTKSWNTLLANVDKSKDSFRASTIEDALPLKTMGILPLFSICYLAEYVSTFSDPLKEKSYAIAIRVILNALYKEFGVKNIRYARVDRLHPFLLYRCFRSIYKLRTLLDASKNNTSLLNIFLNNMINHDYVEKAIRRRFKKDSFDENEFKKMYGIDNENKEINRQLRKVIKNTDGEGELSRLLLSLEERASHEAIAQIFKSGKNGSDFDPSALAFSLGILSKYNNARHLNVISQGLKVIFEACHDGIFISSLPFKIDDKGRAIYVPSIEVANISTIVYLRQIKGVEAPDIDSALSFTKKVKDRMCEHHNNVTAWFEDGKKNKKEKIIYGWCTDKAPSYNRIDSWVTALTMAFFVRRLELLKLAKRIEILKQYSWISWEKCDPPWERVVEPDKGLAKKGVKEKLYEIINADISIRETAPIFLLYGPPGASKTSIVKGIANKMRWDLVMLSPSDFIADSLDRIEQRSRKIFFDLENMEKCVILLDELDSLLRDRADGKSGTQGSILEFVVPAILPKLQRLRDYAMRKKWQYSLIQIFMRTLIRPFKEVAELIIIYWSCRIVGKPYMSYWRDF